MNETRNYECPKCHDEIAIDSKARHDEKIECPHCHSIVHIDTDADFEEGRWQDRTRLSV